jgi:hypothetical protein
MNNKVFIGSGELTNRKATNWSLLNAGRHYNKQLQKEWSHFKAENFKFITLFEAQSPEDVNFLEQCEEYWITFTMATDRNYGYNIYKKPLTKNSIRDNRISNDFLLRIQPM